MSYIIAFVKLANTTKAFPVECFRSDLSVNDEVIVSRQDHKLVTATIADLKYLNWDCKSRIECRTSESKRDDNGKIILPKGTPLIAGITTANIFISFLKKKGWIPIKPKQRMYKAILANTNGHKIAYIFVRKNGLDIQLLPIASVEKPRAYSLYEGSLSEGQVVRHYLAHTAFNLYEGIIRFSNSFLQCEENLVRYFVPVGSRDKRTDELKEKAATRKRIEERFVSNSGERDEMREIYKVCSNGVDGPAYLGDGIWITPDGSTHDWGS